MTEEVCDWCGEDRDEGDPPLIAITCGDGSVLRLCEGCNAEEDDGT